MTRLNRGHSSRHINMERIPIHRNHRQRFHRPIHHINPATTLFNIHSTSFQRRTSLSLEFILLLKLLLHLTRIARVRNLRNAIDRRNVRRRMDSSKPSRNKTSLDPRTGHSSKVPFDNIRRRMPIQLMSDILEDLDRRHVDMFNCSEVNNDSFESRTRISSDVLWINVPRTRELQNKTSAPLEYHDREKDE